MTTLDKVQNLDFRKSLPVILNLEGIVMSKKTRSNDFLSRKESQKAYEANLCVQKTPPDTLPHDCENFRSDIFLKLLPLPEKNEIISDLDKTPVNQLKKTCLPSDNEKDLTESACYFEDTNSKISSPLVLNKESFEDPAPSPGLKVVMRRGDKNFFRNLNLQEDDLLTVDSTLQKELLGSSIIQSINLKEITKPVQGTMQFTLKIPKKFYQHESSLNFGHLELENGARVVKLKKSKKPNLK